MRLGNLRDLDRFKEQMRQLGMDKGTAVLVINDALLREVTTQLGRQIRDQVPLGVPPDPLRLFA